MHAEAFEAELKEGEVSMGTTIMAVTFDGGVVLGADSRTSTGNYIANRVTDKLTQLTDNVFVCRSGSAADTQAITAYVQYYLHQHQMELNNEILVKTAASFATKMVYSNKEMLQAGLIVAGYDSREGGQVYGLPLGGTLVKVPFAIGGSGSGYITGYCDKFWRPGMSAEQCEDFVRRAVGHALARDGSSGGCIRTVTVTKEGIKRSFTPNDRIPAMYGGIGYQAGQPPPTPMVQA
ncbi:g12410 [Coccomyxa viridis]|uniref:Proteasome subunit beta n=1 Tax=Coccomyxa viridis TaxID=1274662 RepID=A0ABP1GHA0_9CHLO